MEKKKCRPVPVIICAVFIALILILPLVFVITEAFSDGLAGWWANITERYTVKALKLSLLSMVAAVVINTVFGLFAAWALTRYYYRGQRILNTLIDIPLSVSPVIAGLIFILTFGRSSPLYPLLQQLHISVIYAVPGIIIATVFVTLPYVSREIIPVLNAIGTAEEEAAALMGAGGWKIFRKITLPHIKWSLLYGIVLCTARSLGEFGAVSVISGHLRGRTNTLPLHIEILYNEFQYSPAFAVSSLLVILAIILLVIRSVVEHRGGKNEQV